MTDAKPPKPDVSPKTDRVVAFVSANQKLIGLAVLAVVGYYGLTDAEFSVPTVWVVAGTFGAVGAVGGWFAGARVVAWLWEPDWRYLLDIDAREDPIKLWRLTPEKFGRLTVIEGDLKRWDARYPVYTCRQYDPEMNICAATWMGSVEDVELLRERERIDEIRESLEAQAQEGMTTRMKASSAVREAVSRITNGMLAGMESSTFDPDGDLEQAIAEAVENHDLDAEIREADRRRESPDDLEDLEPVEAAPAEPEVDP
ncbi:hypothetical protein BRD00_01600 [Halobacteriales archaeon QS_8_69_26]|nr:MAG: hypothetical protein BRD00_01600 [Halobacteriales archaeon QS_8_69_26]